MYSKHTVEIPVNDKDRIESVLRKLSPEFQDVAATPVTDEENEIVGYELSGFFPNEVIELLENPKAATKKLKDAGDGDSEAKNTSFLKRLKKKAGGRVQKISKRERAERKLTARRLPQ